MGQCSEVEGCRLHLWKPTGQTFWPRPCIAKFILLLNWKKDSIFLSGLPVTWLYIMFSYHRQEKSLQSNHSLHSTKLGKFPCCLLTTVLLKPDIVPLTDIIYKYKWHLLVGNYPRWYVVERVSQLRVFKFSSLLSFTFFKKLINEHEQ